MVTRFFRGATYSVTTAPANTRNLSGTEGRDWLEVSTGRSTVFASGGNDVILAGVTFTGFLDSGILGNPSITYTLLPDTSTKVVHANAGNDYVVTGRGNDVVYLGGGNNVYDGAGLLGLTIDEIDTPLGNDTVYAGAGDDIIATGVGNDTIYAGDGNNQIYPFAGNNTIYAGRGNDTVEIDLFRLTPAPTNNRIEVGEGDNTVFLFGQGNFGTNVVVTGSGDDLLALSDIGGGGALGQQRVDAGNGHNLVSVTAAGMVDIRTGNGSDEIWATGKDVTVAAGEGNNLVEVNAFRSAGVRTGNGEDLVILRSFGGETPNAPITSTIEAGEGVNIIATDVPAGSNGRVVTGSRDDLIISGRGNDTIYPGGGNNVIQLGGGSVPIGSPDKFFVEGGGNDTVYAGSGRDLISLGTTGLVTVFQYGRGDRFDVPDGLGIRVTQSGQDAIVSIPGGSPLAIVKAVQANRVALV